MSPGLKWFIAVFTVVVITVAAFLFLVRFHDGPMGIISGGPFTTGTPVDAVEDWDFLDNYMTIELQTMAPPSSRTMWLVVYDNAPYVISSYMNTNVGRLWKQWPKTVEEDPRAIIRVDGMLYEMTLERQTDGDDLLAVLEAFNSKYNTHYTQEAIDSGSSWLFELEPR